MGLVGKLARRLIARRGYELTPAGASAQLRADVTAAEWATWEAVRPFTMTTMERTLGLVRAVEHVVRWEIPGALVECGVWRGGSMMATARTLLAAGVRDRDLWLYDTFAGLPPPDVVDQTYRGQPAAEALAETARREGDDRGYNRAPLDDVRAHVEATGYPAERIRYVVGKVEETIPDAVPERIALLRLDTDWYESTRHELEHLYPRLAPGGVLIVDDYGHWQGARRAVDEYLDRHRIPLLLCRLDYTGRIAVKPMQGVGSRE